MCGPTTRGMQVHKYYSQGHTDLNQTFMASLSQGYLDNDSGDININNNCRANSQVQNHNQDESEIS